MVKAMMIVEGNVQGVGYRVLVKQIARQMKVNGKVKNLEEGTVEMYCEADKAVIEAFKDRINIKAKYPEDILSVNVENIRLYFEGQEGYIPHLAELKTFGIDYGEEAKSAFEKANLERLEMGSLILTKNTDILNKHTDILDNNTDILNRNTDILNKHTDILDKNTDILNKSLGVASESRDIAFESKRILSDFKEETKESFRDLGEKYHTVSKELKFINKNMAKLSGSMERIEAVVTASFGKRKKRAT